jgi:MoaD family protein
MPLVKLYANLRKIAGTKELAIEGTTLQFVLDELIKEKPTLDGLILEKEGLRPHVVVTVNGQNALELNSAISEQDVIAIFPPIAGG